mgnify:CR=1 FL=1
MNKTQRWVSRYLIVSYRLFNENNWQQLFVKGRQLEKLHRFLDTAPSLFLFMYIEREKIQKRLSLESLHAVYKISFTTLTLKTLVIMSRASSGV